MLYYLLVLLLPISLQGMDNQSSGSRAEQTPLGRTRHVMRSSSLEMILTPNAATKHLADQIIGLRDATNAALMQLEDVPVAQQRQDHAHHVDTFKRIAACTEAYLQENKIE